MMPRKQFDVFISHASIDKPAYVDELYHFLKKLGISIFYDSESISWGDNWKTAILTGTEKAEFAIVVISDNFFGHKWTERELYEFLNRQNNTGQKIILPLLYNVSSDTINMHYPELKEIQYIDGTKYSFSDITIGFAKELIKRLKASQVAHPEPGGIFHPTLKNGIKAIDLLDINPFHHPDGSRTSSLIIRQRSTTSAYLYADFTGDNLPDYAGVCVKLWNDNWESFYDTGSLSFSLSCNGDYFNNVIKLEPKSGTENRTIRPYEILLTNSNMYINIPLRELASDRDRAKFRSMTELVFLFQRGVFRGSVDIEINDLMISFN